MADGEYTNEDFLAALVEVQSAAKRSTVGTFSEWRQDGQQQIVKKYNPGSGLGLMGHSPIASRATRSPAQQYGVPNSVLGRPDVPSKYKDRRPDQPPPWINDVDVGSVWYSPMEPVWPYGPPNYTVPREWDFPVGYNINFVSERIQLMGMLRGMRQSWGILSTIIETRKDQLLRLPWTIQVKNKPRATSKGVEHVRGFFNRPDDKLKYGIWSRKLLDDLFVVDAPTLYMDRDIGGRLRSAQVLDGATMFPLIDDVGRRPDSDVRVSSDGIVYNERQPAYQQIIKGLPMVNLSEDEIIYGMMRPRPDMPVFGYSPVEQILTEATEAIRKTFYQMEFWRSGSIPELIITVPDIWTPRQIAAFQGHFDALLSGQLTLKSKVRFIPGGMKPFDIKNASGESLWSQRDELLVRLACYAFSVSPTPFVHQTNRATAGQAAESAAEEGLYPLMSYWKDDIMDTLIQEKLGYDDIEFVYLPRPEADQSKQASIHQIRLHDGEMSINEVRGEIGLEPIEDGDYHLIYTGSAVFRLDQVISGEALAPGSPAPQGEPKPAAPSARSVSPSRGPAQPAQAATNKPATIGKRLTSKEIRQAADKADRRPSMIQTRVGNYPKGHISFNGLSITIENAKGSKRREKDEDDKDIAIKMPAAYGYIRGTIGADDMQVDCYLGKHPESKIVWVIDQDKFDPNGRDNGFDEHKVMLAYRTPQKAIKDHLKSHFDGLGHDRLAAITQMSYGELKHWLKNGDMKKPVSEQGVGTVIGRRGVDNGINKSDTISVGTNLAWYDLGRKQRKKKKEKRKAKAASGARWLALTAKGAIR